MTKVYHPTKRYQLTKQERDGLIKRMADMVNRGVPDDTIKRNIYVAMNYKMSLPAIRNYLEEAKMRADIKKGEIL